MIPIGGSVFLSGGSTRASILLISGCPHLLNPDEMKAGRRLPGEILRSNADAGLSRKGVKTVIRFFVKTVGGAEVQGAFYVSKTGLRYGHSVGKRKGSLSDIRFHLFAGTRYDAGISFTDQLCFR